MPMLQEGLPTSSPIVKFSFSEADLAATQTATDIPIVGADLNTYLMPADGFIVGYAINKTAAHSAGSLDFDIEINGTSTLTIPADTTSVRSLLEVPDEPFAAGDTLGVTYTSDGSLSAETVDVGVDIYVVFTDFNF